MLCPLVACRPKLAGMVSEQCKKSASGQGTGLTLRGIGAFLRAGSWGSSGPSCYP